MGHKANENVCPTTGKWCRNCNIPDHLEKMCKNKLMTSKGRKDGKDRRVRQLGVRVDANGDSEYAFGVFGWCS